MVARSRWRQLGLVAALALLVVACLPLFGDIVDDAYINFRYSRNLIGGHGLVYNLGERVEGYTNFAWIVVLAPLARFGLIELGAAVLGVVATAATMLVVYRAEDRGPLAGLMAPLLIATSTPVVVYSTAGLETTAFMALLTAGWVAVGREAAEERWGVSSILLLLAALTRPEGCLVFAVAALYRLAAAGPSALRDARAWRWLAGFAVPGLAYLAFRWIYFGRLVPNTLDAKTGDLWLQLAGGIDYLGEFVLEAAPLVAAAAVLGPFAARGDRFTRWTLALIGLWIVYVVAIGGDWMRVARHFVPIIGLMALVAQRGLGAATRSLRWLTPARAAALAAALVAAQIAILPFHLDRLERAYQRWDETAGRIGHWLATHGAGEASIAMGDIGEIGYVTDYHVLDILGLVTPAIAELPGGYTLKDPSRAADLVLETAPDYMVLISRRRPTGSRVRSPRGRYMQLLVADERFRSRYRTHLVHRLWPRGYWTVMAHRRQRQPDRLFKIDGRFSRRRYFGWRASGGFAAAPVFTTDDRLWRLGVWGLEGDRCAASLEAPRGRLESRPFTLDGDSIELLVATTEASEGLAVELHVDGRAVRRAGGDGTGAARAVRWDTAAWSGRRARLVAIDDDDRPGAIIAVDWFRQRGKVRAAASEPDPAPAAAPRAPAPPTGEEPADLDALRRRGFAAAAGVIERRMTQREPKMKLTAAEGEAAAAAVLALADSEPFRALDQVMPRSAVELARAVRERGVSAAAAEAIATYLVRFTGALRFRRLAVFDDNHSHVIGRDWHQIDYGGEGMTWQGQRDYWAPRGVADFKDVDHIRAYFAAASKMEHWERVYRPRGRIEDVEK
jgi:hypothetical protein